MEKIPPRLRRVRAALFPESECVFNVLVIEYTIFFFHAHPLCFVYFINTSLCLQKLNY